MDRPPLPLALLLKPSEFQLREGTSEQKWTKQDACHARCWIPSTRSRFDVRKYKVVGLGQGDRVKRQRAHPGFKTGIV